MKREEINEMYRRFEDMRRYFFRFFDSIPETEAKRRIKTSFSCIELQFNNIMDALFLESLKTNKEEH